MGLITKIFGTYSQRELKSINPIVDKIEAMADEYAALAAGLPTKYEVTEAMLATMA